MVTHDLDSLRSICNRIVVIADKGIVADGTIEDMLHHDHPWVQSYFRGRANVPAPANGN
jgi:phospholipid/cholesterol/gamma-HCH transport system ATP-binding protein